MKRADTFRLMRTQSVDLGARNSELLDRAFQIENYRESFPHIFLPSSAAQIFALTESGDSVVAMCAVDTEFWSEPLFLRGACIGSVAVVPHRQRQGLGRTLLEMVLFELLQSRQHDFVYLFSEQTGFYETLGFRAAGIEVIYRLRPIGNLQSCHGHNFRPLRRVADLTGTEKFRLWCALERGRLKGESHASWYKTQMILTMPDMFVSWIEDETHAILSGAFIGKGADFQGVVHTFFADSEYSLQSFWAEFSTIVMEKRIELQVAAGLWKRFLTNGLHEQKQQALCMVLGLTQTQQEISRLFNESQIYPRAAFSS